MNILYLSASYVPSRRASSVQVMKMCAAMAQGGHTVTLVAKDGAALGDAVEDVFGFYRVPAAFRVVRFPRPRRRGAGALFDLRVYRYLRAARPSVDLVFSRSEAGAFASTRLGLPTVLEFHEFPTGALSHRLVRATFVSPSLERVVATSRALAADLVSALDAPADKLLVAHNSADPFDCPDRPDAYVPATLLSSRRPRARVGYVGNLYPGKGVELVVQLAAAVPDCDFHVVGGEPADLEAWRRQTLPANVRFHGFVSQQQLGCYYAAFDLLLLPVQRTVFGASRRVDNSRWTSSLKMFEYLAAGRPMISSDLPVLKEVLHDGHNALIVPPDDVRAWAAAVERLLADAALRARLSQSAREDFARLYTWQARAQRVLSGLEGRKGLPARRSD